MEEQVRQLVLSTKERIDASDDKSELNDLRVSVLGKSGQFAFLMRELKIFRPNKSRFSENWSTTPKRKWKII